MEITLHHSEFRENGLKAVEDDVIPRRVAITGIYSAGEGMLRVEYDLKDPEPAPPQANLPTFLRDWLNR